MGLGTMKSNSNTSIEPTTKLSLILTSRILSLDFYPPHRNNPSSYIPTVADKGLKGTFLNSLQAGLDY